MADKASVVSPRADTTPPTATPPISRHRTWTLLVACCGVLVVISSMVALNTALGDIAMATSANQTQLTWIIDSYTLTLACLLLPAGAGAELTDAQRAEQPELRQVPAEAGLARDQQPVHHAGGWSGCDAAGRGRRARYEGRDEAGKTDQQPAARYQGQKPPAGGIHARRKGKVVVGGVVVVPVAPPGLLLGQGRPMADHALDQIAGQGETIGGPFGLTAPGP